MYAFKLSYYYTILVLGHYGGGSRICSGPVIFGPVIFESGPKVVAINEI